MQRTYLNFNGQATYLVTEKNELKEFKNTCIYLNENFIFRDITLFQL